MNKWMNNFLSNEWMNRKPNLNNNKHLNEWFIGLINKSINL